MSDLISRQAAIEAVGYYSLHSGDKLLFADKPLRELPSAQPEITLESAIDYLHSIGWMQEHDRIMAESAQQERKTGRWIRGGAYPHHIFCSACYATYVPNDEWDIWKADGTYCWRLPRQFCPNCGAKMDEVSG